MMSAKVFAVLMLAQVPPAGMGDQAIEWLKFGLLGGVLGWVFMIHLPAKDKREKDRDEQLRAYLEEERKERDRRENAQTLEREREREEREKERKARHDMATSLQVTVNGLTLGHKEQMIQLNELHRSESERDRTAFMLRSTEQGRSIELLQKTIENQTLALVAAIEKGACRSGDPRKA